MRLSEELLQTSDGRLPIEEYLCPYCNRWHEARSLKNLICPSYQNWQRPMGRYSIGFERDSKSNELMLTYDIKCGKIDWKEEDTRDAPCIKGKVPISSLVQKNEGEPIFSFDARITHFCNKGCLFTGCPMWQDNFKRVPKDLKFGFKINETVCNHYLQMQEDRITPFGHYRMRKLVNTTYGIAYINYNAITKETSYRSKYDAFDEEVRGLEFKVDWDSPIFFCPVTHLNKKDIIKYEGEYFRVKENATNETPVQAYNIRDDANKEIPPVNVSVLGFRCFCKAIVFNDSINAEDKLALKRMLIVRALSGTWANENRLRQAWLLFALRSKLNSDEGLKELLYTYAMVGGDNTKLVTNLMGEAFTNEEMLEDTSN